MISKNHILLDCDPGEDDALAILLAVSKNLDLMALVCGFGNSSAEKTYKNGAGLLALAKATDIPLFKGAEEPYRPHPWEKEIVSAGDFVGENGLCGISLPTPPDSIMAGSNLPQDKRLDTIVDYLRDKGPLTYIVTGPCTTLAHILNRLGEQAKDIIKQVIIMGGALDAAGNTGPINPETGKPYAEFNFYCDPFAVARVFASGLPVTLVPWDLTEQIVLKYEELDNWQSNTPQGSFALKLMRNFLESYGNVHERSFEFNDCITITAFEKDGLFKKEKVRLLLEGEQTGRLVRDDQNGTEVKFFGIERGRIFAVRNNILNLLGVTEVETDQL
jgi:purine nucleosidase